MQHASQTNLIMLAAGELSDTERAQIEQHLAECAACRTLAEEHDSLRGLLGAWSVEARSRDLWTAVEAGLDAPEPVVLRPTWGRFTRLARVAALVVVGLGLGHVTGRLTRPTPPNAPDGVDLVSDEDLLEMLGLHYLETPSATGLFTTVLEVTAPRDDEEATS